jgi:hypothetical protein
MSIINPKTPEYAKQQLAKAIADGVVTAQEVIQDIAPYAQPDALWADDKYHDDLIALAYGFISPAHMPEDALVGLRSLLTAANKTPSTPEMRKQALAEIVADGVVTAHEVEFKIAPYAQPDVLWGDNKYHDDLIELMYSWIPPAQLTPEAHVGLDALLTAANHWEPPFVTVETPEAKSAAGFVDPGEEGMKAIYGALVAKARASGKVTPVTDPQLIEKLDALQAQGEGLIINDVADAVDEVIEHDGWLYVQTNGFAGPEGWKRFGSSSDVPVF